MATPQQMLATLMNAPTPDQVRQQLIQILAGFNLPTNDWNSTSWERGIVESDSQALWTFVANLIPAIAGGGFVDLANAQWLPLLALELYNLIQNQPTYTQGNMTLTCAASAGPYTISPGQLIAQGAGGNLYTNATGGVLASGGTLALLWQAQSPGSSYNDGSGTIVSLVTALAGVTISNPAPAYSATVRTGTGGGTGTVTPSGVANSSYGVTVRIDAGGQAGVASWSYSINGGAYLAAGAVATLVNAGGTGITITLANGAVNPSFVVGDYYAFNSPGSWVTQSGTDLESQAALVGRCKNRWPSLATLAAIPGSPTLGFYDLLTRQASSQVIQTLVLRDLFVNNKLNIYVAGSTGALPAAVVTAIQAFLIARNMLTDNPFVVSPTNRVINFTATIRVQAAFLLSAQIALQAYLQNYVQGRLQSFVVGASTVTIAGVAINGLIELFNEEQLAGLIPGITNVTGVSIGHDGGSYQVTDMQLPITPGNVEVPVWSELVASTFTWVPY